MCGRYTLKTPIDMLAEHFGIDEYPSSLTPSYNVAPTQEVVGVVEEGEKSRLGTFLWGLIPSWAKDPAIGNKMINARAETVSEKPSFRSAFKKRRCLIVADASGSCSGPWAAWRSGSPLGGSSPRSASARQTPS